MKKKSFCSKSFFFFLNFMALNEEIWENCLVIANI
jgi:hypothetical protein